MKKLLALWMVLALLIAAIPALAEEAAAEPVVVTIFHTNDTHTRHTSEVGMGFAMMASYVNAARAAGENVLVLDAGDTLHGLVFANMTKGESIVAIMNAIGYDAMAPGNHDFNYGYEHLKELEKQMNFPLLNANIKIKEDGSNAFTPYTIVESGGKKIGIIGAANPEYKTSVHPDYTAKLDFQDRTPILATVALIRDQVDALIILAHWGVGAAYVPDTVEALASIPGVALVIDGHSHTVLYDIEQGEEGTALVTSTGEYLNNLGKVTLTFAPEGGLTVEAGLIPKPAAFEDHAMINVIEELEAEQSVILDQVIGETTVDLEAERAISRTSETNWGNLSADIIAEVTGAEVALLNGGGVRQSIPAGPITARDINNAFPFNNLVVLKEVNGQALLDTLETGVRYYPETSGGFPQISGMSFTFDPSKPAGERVVELLIGGEPVDPAAMYTLATNDYLASGGDGYDSLGAFPDLMIMGTLDEVITDYLRESGPVSPVVEGRIVAVEAAAE
ncbi:MAG: bifunctional metallophosphatase/5'-nucleotidase [Oscillospiraceae bacterium]|jgi:2',3'-cyclic-nucleotide 2'-phosphodiesterase (5'-nucleotidase family)|nr:bifunctional metallophosphatase/5'-nucleotidase [Oscillospiraceae bacterium]